MEKEKLIKMDLQLFADENKDNVDENLDNVDESENVNNEPETSEKTFTQEQVNKIMSKEKKQGRNSILKELGINPNDKNAIENIKTLLESQKTNEEKAIEKEIENQKIIAEAEKRAVIAEAKVEAMTKGVKAQFVDDVITLAMAKAENSGEELELKTIIDEFRVKYPIWFDGTENENKVGQKGTGSTVGGAANKTNNSNSIGARLATQKKNNSNNNGSFWSH